MILRQVLLFVVALSAALLLALYGSELLHLIPHSHDDVQAISTTCVMVEDWRLCE